MRRTEWISRIQGFMLEGGDGVDEDLVVEGALGDVGADGGGDGVGEEVAHPGGAVLEDDLRGLGVEGEGAAVDVVLELDGGDADAGGEGEGQGQLRARRRDARRRRGLRRRRAWTVCLFSVWPYRGGPGRRRRRRHRHRRPGPTPLSDGSGGKAVGLLPPYCPPATGGRGGGILSGVRGEREGDDDQAADWRRGAGAGERKAEAAGAGRGLAKK